jgi:inner membrane protein
MDLFQNGFWSTINNNFNDVKHQITVYKKSPFALKIEYNYSIYQNNFIGNGILLQATSDEIFILDKKEILSLKKNTPGLNIITLKTSKTSNRINIKTIEINNYNESEFNNFLKDKFITTGIIYSNYNTALTSNPLDVNKKFNIENKYDLNFKSSFEDTLYINREKKIAELKIKLKNEENQLINDNKSYYSDLNMLKIEKNKLNSNLSNYEINETKKNIIELEAKIQAYKPKTNLMIPEYIKQINQINKSNLQQIKYSGKLYFITIV